jgi:predicted RNA-binding Zn ribbon-like protein
LAVPARARGSRGLLRGGGALLHEPDADSGVGKNKLAPDAGAADTLSDFFDEQAEIAQPAKVTAERSEYKVDLRAERALAPRARMRIE